MLKLLKIKNIALIQQLELEFGTGLTLLTGETGAGKSILIDALGLALGARASSDLIRTGEDQAVVEALFEAPQALAWLEEHGLACEGDEVIIRRELSASGKGRASVNGSLLPASLLKDLAPLLATIHGQHEPQGLLDAHTHLDMLDAHAGLSAETLALAGPFQALKRAESELASLRRDRQELERRRETLEFQLAEIEKARLATGEEEALLQEKAILANAGRLAGLAEEAYGLLYDREDAVLPLLAQAYRRLDELAGIDARIAPLLGDRGAVQAHLDELARFVRDYRERAPASPGRLDEVENRLALIERLHRKYGPSVAEILAFAERCRRDLEPLASPEEAERRLEAERAAAARDYLAAASALSKKRRGAAKQLEAQVERELAALAMEKTRFRVRFEPDLPDPDTQPWTEKGLERCEFLLSPNPGEELRPLARIASGGELSRIMLALKSVASSDGPGKTLVFDEVDAGIGGRVAEVVGRKLKAIAANHQVLCVTHLPQIASQANVHFAVRKHVERGRTLTQVETLTESGRVEEVARLLGGATVTETARRHALEMVRQNIR